MYLISIVVIKLIRNKINKNGSILKNLTIFIINKSYEK